MLTSTACCDQRVGFTIVQREGLFELVPDELPSPTKITNTFPELNVPRYRAYVSLHISWAPEQESCKRGRPGSGGRNSEGGNQPILDFCLELTDI